MEYDDWSPIYNAILVDFGFERSADVRARDVIAEYATPFDTSRLDVAGATVAIAGGADTLSDEIQIAADADVVFAASTAADLLDDAGVQVDLLVTDLDKNPATVRRYTHNGIPVAAHAHGDNIPLIREWVPRFDAVHVLATTQCEPVDSVYNYGGFTDGDRAAYLADALGAAELRFPGWDFDDPNVDGMKSQKLAWAERLLHLLETRRGDRFPVLDGRRSKIDPLQ